MNYLIRDLITFFQGTYHQHWNKKDIGSKGSFIFWNLKLFLFSQWKSQASFWLIQIYQIDISFCAWPRKKYIGSKIFWSVRIKLHIGSSTARYFDCFGNDKNIYISTLFWWAWNNTLEAKVENALISKNRKSIGSKILRMWELKDCTLGQDGFQRPNWKSSARRWNKRKNAFSARRSWQGGYFPRR